MYDACERALISVAGADLFTKLLISVSHCGAQMCAVSRGSFRAEECVEAGPFGGERFVFALELAADDADGVGGDAAVEAARAGDVGHDLSVEEVLDGGEEFVEGGAVLHEPPLAPAAPGK